MLAFRLIRGQKLRAISKSPIAVQRLFRAAAAKLKQTSPLVHLTPIVPVPLFAFSLLGSSSSSKSDQKTTSAIKMAEVLQNADQLMDESSYQECLDLLLAQPDQDAPEIMWRKARAMQKLAKTATDKKQREDYIRKAYALVKDALEKDQENFAIHKWYAILLDANAELDGVKARVSEIEKVRFHMVRATELKPDDPTSWYILGELEYSLADMSWYVQKIVSALFATPPKGTFERALECFEKAEGLEPKFYSKNNLMLGKTYMALKNNEKAKEQFTIAMNVKVANIDDKNAKEEAEKLIKKL